MRASPAIGDDMNGGHDDHDNTASRFKSPGKPPMKGKRKLLLAVAGAILLAFISFSWFQSHQSYSRWAGAYARVQLGMTRAEVTEAIGLPPAYYEGERPMPPSMSRFVRTPPLKQAGLAYEDLDGAERKMLEVWVGQDFVIWVLFGEDGAAVGSYLLELHPDGHRTSAFIMFLEDSYRRLGF
jgi:hypothetical protein